MGGLTLGGGAPISVQSMTKTPTHDVQATVAQIHLLEEAGCDLVRVAVPDAHAAEALGAIKAQIHIPLVADIHFNHRLALTAIAQGVDKLRLNPGNLRRAEHIRQVVQAAKERGIPIRIGVNNGSIDPALRARFAFTHEGNARALVESALGHIRLLEEEGVHRYRRLAESLGCHHHRLRLLFHGHGAQLPAACRRHGSRVAAGRHHKIRYRHGTIAR